MDVPCGGVFPCGGVTMYGAVSELVKDSLASGSPSEDASTLSPVLESQTRMVPMSYRFHERLQIGETTGKIFI